METHTHTLNVWGFDMEVTFDYQPPYPSSLYDPGETEYASIGPVVVGGVDIYEMLNDKQITRIEEAALKAIHDQQNEARADAAIDYAMDRANGYANVFFDALNRIGGTR